jgi:hypothetical protein
MPHTTSHFVRRAFASLLAGTLGCSGGELVLPDPVDGGANVALTKFQGDEQIGTVGEELPAPLIVRVLTEHEHPVLGRKVVFVASDPVSGEVSPDTSVSNEDGQATARWVLGTAPGSYVVTAYLVGGEAENQTAEFRAAARAAAPDTLRPTTALTQPGSRKNAAVTPPQVHVADRYGNAVPDVAVAWQVTAGGGHVAEPITQTDSEGNATVQWTLGDRIGVHKLNATIGNVSGSPVTFTAMVLF